MNIKPRHDPPVPPVSKAFESHANDEEERRRLPPRWPIVSGEKPPKPAKKEEEKRSQSGDDGVKAIPTVIYQKAPNGTCTLKIIPEDKGHLIECRV